MMAKIGEPHKLHPPRLAGAAGEYLPELERTGVRAGPSGRIQGFDIANRHRCSRTRSVVACLFTPGRSWAGAASPTPALCAHYLFPIACV